MPKCKDHHELSIELANHHRPNPFKVNGPGPVQDVPIAVSILPSVRLRSKNVLGPRCKVPRPDLYISLTNSRSGSEPSLVFEKSLSYLHSPLPDQASSEQRPPVQGVMPPVQKGLETLSDMPKFMTINNVLEKSPSHTPSAGWVAVNHSRPDGSEDRIGNLQLVELNNDDDYKGMRPEGTDVPDEDEPTVEEEDQSPVSSSLKSFNGLC